MVRNTRTIRPCIIPCATRLRPRWGTITRVSFRRINCCATTARNAARRTRRSAASALSRICARTTSVVMLRKILVALSVAAGAVYLVNPNVFVKGTSVGALAVLAFASGSPILGLALALGSLGDVLLDLDPQRLFVFGLASFLVG